jgi:8-oxo-dGTP diphosphatase
MPRWRQDVPRVTVDAIVLDSGKVVLVKRRNRPYRGMYSIPGGYVELWEPPEEAVLREVSEETGLRVSIEGLFAVYGDPRTNPHGSVHVVAIVYVVRKIGGTLRAGADVRAVRAFRLSNLPSKLGGYHKRVLSDFRKAQRRAMERRRELLQDSESSKNAER